LRSLGAVTRIAAIAFRGVVGSAIAGSLRAGGILRR
jgi:hypothetical protein